ncbi:hypothetical protein DFJ74DRAFT_769590 [Hyaloraphidium curvatum]|nr:hypothetical protein DFJ74DRAFT_769590 [Hyaloraphidium curvatum]
MQFPDRGPAFAIPRRRSDPCVGAGAAWPRDMQFVRDLMPRRASADAALAAAGHGEPPFGKVRSDSLDSDATLGGDGPAAGLARYRAKAPPPPLDTHPPSPSASDSTLDSPLFPAAAPSISSLSSSPASPFPHPRGPSATPDASFPARASASFPCARAAARLRRPSGAVPALPGAAKPRKRVRFLGAVEVRETWAVADYARGYPPAECERILREGLESLRGDLHGKVGPGLRAYTAVCGDGGEDLRGYWGGREVAA